MSEEKHKIRKGDWIIRNPEPPPRHYSQESAAAAHIEKLIGLNVLDYNSYSEYAVYVLDSTQHHLVIFDPLIGRRIILVYDRLPGTWHYATQVQVETSWDHAETVRTSHKMQIEQEKKAFLWKTPEKR